MHWQVGLVINDKRILNMKKYVNIYGINWTGISFDQKTRGLGVFISDNILRPYIENLGEQRLYYTDYNRHIVKWFKFQKIDSDSRQIVISFRYRYEKLEDKPLIGGRFTVYDNAANVIVGLNLEVNRDRTIVGKNTIISIELDWASGILGYIQGIQDILIGSVSWLTNGNFVRLTDAVVSLTTEIANFSFEDRLKITEPFSEINDLNQKGLIYLDKLDYDSEGLWLIFSIDLSRLPESIPIINALIGKIGK